MLYYWGPLGGTAFIGHRLNAVCREIQIMENQQPGYAHAFLLRRPAMPKERRVCIRSTKAQSAHAKREAITFSVVTARL